MLVAQLSNASSSDGRGGAGQIYVTDDAPIDESVTPGVRYPLHRLERQPSIRGLAARERERVARLFPRR